jgi:hypothetical protein
VEAGKIGVTFSAKKTDFPKYLGFVTILAEAAVVVLHIMGREDDPIGNFNKICVITTGWAGKPHAHISSLMAA